MKMPTPEACSNVKMAINLIIAQGSFGFGFGLASQAWLLVMQSVRVATDDH
jgi:hypothetical protein